MLKKVTIEAMTALLSFKLAIMIAAVNGKVRNDLNIF